MIARDELTHGTIDQKFPYQMEPPIPSGGLGMLLDHMDGFCGEQRLKVAPRKRMLRRDDFYFVRWCFAEPADAERFRERFGGNIFTVPPKRRDR